MTAQKVKLTNTINKQKNGWQAVLDSHHITLTENINTKTIT